MPPPAPWSGLPLPSPPATGGARAGGGERPASRQPRRLPAPGGGGDGRRPSPLLGRPLAPVRAEGRPGRGGPPRPGQGHGGGAGAPGGTAAPGPDEAERAAG